MKFSRLILAAWFIAGSILAFREQGTDAHAEGLGSEAPSKANLIPRRFKIPKRTFNGRSARPDRAEVSLGERLFLETRFAQFFFAHFHGNANTNLPMGDPALQSTVTSGQQLPGPFAGLSMNCRACHLVNEHAALGRGHRTYADYARRSPIPAREDGKTATARNSPAMVDASVARSGDLFLHYDGEFASSQDLGKENKI